MYRGRVSPSPSRAAGGPGPPPPPPGPRSRARSPAFLRPGGGLEGLGLGFEFGGRLFIFVALPAFSPALPEITPGGLALLCRHRGAFLPFLAGLDGDKVVEIVAQVAKLADPIILSATLVHRAAY